MNHIVITNTITNRDNMLNSYLKDIRRYPMLSSAAQDNLARIMRQGGKAGDDARRQLIECNLRFAVTVAKKYESDIIPLVDLINDANIGLCRACDSYDPQRTNNFISYAVNYMLSEIYTDFEKHGRLIRLPHDVRTCISEYNKLVESTLASQQRMPTVDEFAVHSKLSHTKAAHILEHLGNVESLSSPMGGSDDDMTLEDVVFVESSTVDYLESQFTRSVIDTTLREVLKDDDYRIVQAVYGLLGDNGPTVSSLSYEMGISPEAIKKRCTRSLKKIRNNPKAMDEFRQLLAA